MDSVRAALYLSVCLAVTAAVFQGRSSPLPRGSAVFQGRSSPLPRGSAQEDDLPGYNEIMEVLQGALEEAEDRVGLSVEKKASVIPRCDVGERCAMKHGPRIGRLCDCLRGTACNTFFLRCY